MPYDLSIPGWMSERNLKVIERIARRVPDYGHIVEIGSFCGRSATAWASSAPSATVSCIDTWQLNFQQLGPNWRKGAHGDPARYRETAEETFHEVTRDLVNIVQCKGRSTFDWKLRAADVVFLDGDHRQAAVTAELCHWSARLTPGGLLCGDDYRSEPSWLSVMIAVTNFATRIGYDLFVPAKSTIWILFESRDHMRKWWS
jgi:predicted O-methyltransferase YrrM